MTEPGEEGLLVGGTPAEAGRLPHVHGLSAPVGGLGGAVSITCVAQALGLRCCPVQTGQGSAATAVVETGFAVQTWPFVLCTIFCPRVRELSWLQVHGREWESAGHSFVSGEGLAVSGGTLFHEGPVLGW